MPYFMCPNCKLRRSIVSGAESLGEEPDHTRPPCFNCACDQTFEMRNDYFPADATAFVVIDSTDTIKVAGSELEAFAGLSSADVVGGNLYEKLALSAEQALADVREHDARRLEQELTMRNADGVEVTVWADFFPSPDMSGDILVAVTPV
ncbi:MAG: hypothetical protein F2663_03785 [Actinobacteria bacterium]|uniref:Unannotated protein n=1 Tax=freshwater metagenome TaxID=449393 RepID=A0A6J6NZE0_9ZZZZ|nr:hypothetical protein [Actinomycetota bacterium]